MDEEERERARDFHYDRERRRQLGEVWREKFKDNFRDTMNSVTNIQARKILYIEIVFLSLIIGLTTNILSTNIYDLFFTGNYRVLSIFSILTICFIIFCVFGFLHVLNVNYKPHQIPLHLTFSVKDMKGFVKEETYIKILKFLENEELKDFSKFPERFKKGFVHYLPNIFLASEISRVPIIDRVEHVDEVFGPKFPTSILVFDLSDLVYGGVNIHLQIKIVPKVIFKFGREGDKTAVRDITIHIWFYVLNPEHHKSDEILRQFYERFIHRFPEYLSFILEWTFKKYIPRARDSEELGG